MTGKFLRGAGRAGLETTLLDARHSGIALARGGQRPGALRGLTLAALAALALAGLMALGLALRAAPATAAFPGENGSITFTSGRDGNNEIYVMDADGQNQTNLTNNAARDEESACSPDGNRIVFTSARDGNTDDLRDGRRRPESGQAHQQRGG